MQEQLVELSMVFHGTCTLRKMYDFWFAVCNSYKKIAKPAIQT